MTTYQERKEAARQAAIDWSLTPCAEPMSYGELADWQAHFEKLGRRFGLLREFRENAIC